MHSHNPLRTMSEQAVNRFIARLRPLPAVDEILAEYDFDYDSSELRYPKTRGWGAWGGRRAGNGWAGEHGCKGRGYISLRVGKVTYSYHRLVWKMFTGRDPVGVIDHINGDRQDNRIENLRDVSPADNSRNNHGAGHWAKMRTIRVRELKRRRSLEHAAKRLEFEKKERAELARLVAKYGCCNGEELTCG